ncbi:MAG: aldehyde dehydrogenase family protein [Vicinamibacteraceae bacterium]|nr:aldehyde dehydrogenase family protein [Vicinamibacteraceae bacterium]
MAEELLNYVAGEWRRCRDATTFDNEDPAARGSVLNVVQASGPDELTEAIEAADLAFRTWRRVPLHERQACIGRFLDLVRASRDELATIVSRENGKTISEARAEIDSAIVEGTYHLHQVSAFVGHLGVDVGDGLTAWMQHHPIGVVGVISPWNFPVNVMCRKAIPALLTGNTVVFKPASFTPWCALEMAKLFVHSGLPPGVFNCVTGLGSRVGNALLDDPRVRAISFTGSTEVGKRIQARAANHLIRTQLELGGKNALIVLPDANLDDAATAAMTAGFACAGQWCTSTSRVLVHEQVADAFTARLAARCDAVRVGPPLEESTGMGPVAGPEQFASIQRAIEIGIAEGASLVTGGVCREPRATPGYYIRPTVFTGVRPEMFLFREEIFGPVLALTRVESLDQAIELANDSMYGLSSALFTRDLSAAQRYIDAIDAGLAHVNVHSGYKHPALPFGGWKQSGFGPPENSRTGLEFFVDRKAVYLKGA